LAEIFGVEFKKPEITRLIDLMTESAQSIDSPTFRKGQPGEWQHSFTNEHKDLFKEIDKDNWLIRLGYETSQDW
jgi:hypothetical protein